MAKRLDDILSGFSAAAPAPASSTADVSVANGADNNSVQSNAQPASAQSLDSILASMQSSGENGSGRSDVATPDTGTVPVQSASNNVPTSSDAGISNQQNGEKRHGVVVTDPLDIIPQPEFFDAIKERTKALIEHPIDTLTQAVKDTPAATVGLGESVIAAGADIAGAIKGLGQAVIDTGSPAGYVQSVIDTQRYLLGMPSSEGIRTMPKFLKTLPEKIAAGREAFHYEPVTESGKAIVNMFGATFGAVSELGQKAGDVVFEKTSSPALATAARVIPDTVVMLAGIKAGKGTSEALPLQQMFEKNLERLVTKGETKQVFSQEKLTEHKVKTADIIAERNKLIDERQSILTATSPSTRTPEQQLRLKEIKDRLNQIATEHMVIEGGTVKMTMNTNDLVSQLSPEQLKKIKTEVVVKIGEKGAEKPITLERGPDGNLTVKDGLEELSAAHILGNGQVPVIIKEDVINPQRAKELADRVNAFEESGRQLEKDLAKKLSKSLGAKTAELFFDVRAGLKARLLKTFGKKAIPVIQFYELAQHAGSSTAMFSRDHIEPIFRQVGTDVVFTRTVNGKPLKVTSEMVLNELVRSRVVQEIARRNKNRKKPYTFPGNLGPVEHAARIAELRQQLGPAEFERFQKLSDRVFDTYRALLDASLAEGLINKKSYKKLIDFDYAPTKHVDILDPIDTVFGKEGLVQVRSSGVHHLGEGSVNPVEMSARNLLLDTAYRTFSRIAKNRTTLALARVARQDKGNGLVLDLGRIKDPKKRKAMLKRASKKSEIISYFEDGQRKYLALDRAFAQEFRTLPTVVSSEAAKLLQYISGTALVKPAAVGVNPGFFIADFPRNVGHLMLAGGRTFGGDALYSGRTPIIGPLQALKEIATDMVAVAPDVFHKRGLFRELAERNAFPFFIADVARESVGRTVVERIGDEVSGRNERIKNVLKDTARVLGWVNNFSEALMRTAIARRVIENQKKAKRPIDLDSAAFEASRIIDYAQFGYLSKSLDQVIPFFNPAMQATRTVLRGAREDPIRFGSLMLSTAFWSGFLYLSNYIMNDEGTAMLSDQDLGTGINFVLPPWLLSSVNPEGEQTYSAIHINVEPAFMPVIGYTNLLMRRYFEGREPSKMMLDILAKANPFAPSGMLPPTLDVYMKMFRNYDFWRDRAVFEGNRDAWGEYYQGHERNATPRFYVELGRILAEKLNLKPGDALEALSSPERIREAFDTFTGGNTVAFGVGRAIDLSLFGPNEREQMKGINESISELPFMRRILRVVSPNVNAFSDASPLTKSNATKQQVMADEVDGVLFRYYNKGIGLEEATRQVLNIQQQLDPFDTERLLDRFSLGAKLLPMFRGLSPKQREGLPGVKWWLFVASKAPKDRAAIFYNQWKNTPPGRRETLMSLAWRLSAAGGKFRLISPEMWMEFERLKKRSGARFDGAVIPDGVDLITDDLKNGFQIPDPGAISPENPRPSVSVQGQQGQPQEQPLPQPPNPADSPQQPSASESPATPVPLEQVLGGFAPPDQGR